jgi:hypothetical protein
MTEHDIIIAISIHLDYQFWKSSLGDVWVTTHTPSAPGYRKLKSIPAKWEKIQTSAVPDFGSDLNAMHEAEATLTPTQWPEYVGWLGLVTRDRNGEGVAFATAIQRAEAFLRTVGKWQETPDNQQPITDNPAPTP